MRSLIICIGMIGFLAVALGAFGAHGLEGRLTAEAQDWWATATLYALVHAAAALAVAMAAKEARAPAAAGWAFVVGAVIFSGSLYAMALFSLFGGAPRFLGAVTPIGGVAFLAGWALIIWRGVRR